MPKSKTHPDWRARAHAVSARPSVLSVIAFRFRPRGYMSTGMGFVVKRDAQNSIVLTSGHYLGVVKRKDQLVVRRMTAGGVQQLPASVIYSNSVADVAILRVPGLTGVRPLRFAHTFVGQSVVAVGYSDPINLFAGTTFTRIPAMSPGRVMEPWTIDLGTHFGITVSNVILDCVAMEGMSGGPVLSSGGVVAMVDSGARGFTRAVSLVTILQVLKTHLGVGLQDNMTMEQVIELIA
ncbi:hypothetical protein BS78_10G033200 [Paspalum vaginatum]|nr:hypothetical protein BS78_10G033200 [Paspalum vaginatum]